MSEKRITSSSTADGNHDDESEAEMPPESTIPSDCERTAEEIAEGFRCIAQEDADEEWWAPAKGLAREDITAALDAHDQEIEEAEEAAQQERAAGDLRRELQRADEDAAKKRRGKNTKPTKSKRTTSDKPKKMRWKSNSKGISSAITDLNDPASSSSSAIKKRMQANMPAGKRWLNSTFQSTLKKMTADGVLVQVKAAYKLPTDEARREADTGEARRREAAAAADEAFLQAAAAAEAARQEAVAEEARRQEVATAEEARREAATAAEAARLQQPVEDHQDQQDEDPIVQAEPSPSTPTKVHPLTDTTAKRGNINF